MPFATVVELSRGLRGGEFNSRELTAWYLERIDKLNGTLNCFITIDEDGAMRDAAIADKVLAGGNSGILTGIPIAHKDLFCTQGLRTTCGSRMLAGFEPPYDATVVERTRTAGAISLGKTNMDEFAMGSSNETSYFGCVANPWDIRRSPGGSSGGAACAVAAGLVPLATGTDTGGSIRQPAGFCGISGLKPTYGRISRFGMIAFASSLDQGGPMAMNVEDVELLLQAMEGFDERDSTSAKVASTEIRSEPRRYRIGYPHKLMNSVSPEIAFKIETAREVLEKQGHSTVDIALEHTEVAVAAYYVISGAEASANLARFDGVRYGHRSLSPVDVNDLYCRSRSEGFGLEVKRRILTGIYALSVGYYEAYYEKAQRIRRLIKQSFEAAFESVDVILAPVTPTTAFEIGSMRKDPVTMYQQDTFTIPASLAGLPALSLPCGQLDGLPIGMQLVGTAFDEATILHLGRLYQQDTDWHMRHPENLN